MKERPILILAITLTLAIELILIFWILSSKSNIGLFLLADYHIISGLFGMYSKGSAELLGQILIGYHLTIGVIIYFQDWIENKIGIKNVG